MPEGLVPSGCRFPLPEEDMGLTFPENCPEPAFVHKQGQPITPAWHRRHPPLSSTSGEIFYNKGLLLLHPSVLLLPGKPLQPPGTVPQHYRCQQPG